MNSLRWPTSALPFDSVTVELMCHPATPCSAALKVSASLAPRRTTSGWELQLVYQVTGDIQRLRLPALTEPSPADGLWAHTCFEAFFSEPGSQVAYRECNFSPSTQWAHYRFTDERVRDGDAAALALPVVQAPEVTANRLRLTASIPIRPLHPSASALRCALTAVLELADGSLSYWAVHHSAPQPDFHARNGWVVPQRWTVL
ncbi:MAG: DOMON-like domain-containing protein [Hydrogenophaga sp.]